MKLKEIENSETRLSQGVTEGIVELVFLNFKLDSNFIMCFIIWLKKMLDPLLREEGIYKVHSAQGRSWENKPCWHNLFRSKNEEQGRGLQNNGFSGQEGRYSYERKSHIDMLNRLH